MRRNRTKPDWAAKQAERILDKPFHDRYDRIRAIAVVLRRAERRGRKKEIRAFCDAITKDVKSGSVAGIRKAAATFKLSEYKDFEGLADKIKREENLQHLVKGLPRILAKNPLGHPTCSHGFPRETYCMECGI